MTSQLTRDLFLERFSLYRPGDDRNKGDHDLNPGFEPQGRLRPAAVLVPLVDRPDGLHLLLTRRTDHLLNHAGQISFPGGHIDPVDGNPDDKATAINAALREADEEIGLKRDSVQLVGQLATYVTRTGFRVTPIVGLVEPDLQYVPDPHEVAEVFEVPLAFLLDPCNHQRCTYRIEDRDRHFWAMPYGDYYIWGATAGMIKNLCHALKVTA